MPRYATGSQDQHNTRQGRLFRDHGNPGGGDVLRIIDTAMRVKSRAWAIAVCGALLAAAVAFYMTRPASQYLTDSSAQFVGRDHPSGHAPDPLTSDEIGYQVPRDRIRAIDNPKFITADQAGFVPDQMPVIGVRDGGEAKAYPIPVLSRAEIVNDQVGGRAIAVTW